jgi:hypothetical protein
LFLSRALVAGILGAVLAISHASETDSPRLDAVPDPGWDKAFTRESGWTGGDVVGTVDLEDGRLLWSFGDSWIGKVEGNRHVDSRLVNNTVAIQTQAIGAAPRVPGEGELSFYWGSASEGQPQAWLAPPMPASGNGRPAKDDWYWFTGGGVVARGPDHKPRLALFLFQIAKNGSGGVWGFESRGSVMATIDDFSGAPNTWRVAQHTIPFAVGAQSVRQDSSLRETAWGMAAFREPVSDEASKDEDSKDAGSDKEDPENEGSREVVYIYGVRSISSFDRRLLLARAPAGALTDFEAWRFYAAGGRWSSSVVDAESVATNVPTELSVERLRLGDQMAYVMIHSEPPLSGRVMLRVALSPHGPWSAPAAIYSAPGIERDKRFFAYAAKGHIPLSAPQELLVSYVVNSHDFNAMVQDATIYRPRFVRTALSAQRLAELLKSVDAPAGK